MQKVQVIRNWTRLTRENVNQLQVAWTFNPNDVPDGLRFGKFECNPIVVDGIMYSTSARRWLYAINAETGEKAMVI